jgi:hemerythrin superfamily protein
MAHQIKRDRSPQRARASKNTNLLEARVAEFAERWTAHAASEEQTIFIWLAEILAPAVLEDIGAELGARSAQSHCLAA